MLSPEKIKKLRLLKIPTCLAASTRLANLDADHRAVTAKPSRQLGPIPAPDSSESATPQVPILLGSANGDSGSQAIDNNYVFLPSPGL